jgi:outer membrane protein assembly factor BamB
MELKRARSHSAAVLTVTLTVITAGCGGLSDADSPQWTRFRGPNGTGVSPEQNLPVHWKEDGTGVRWTAEIPPGVSSPIVSRWQVILTGETVDEGETSLKVLSLDLRTGKQLWEKTVLSRKREKFPMRSVVNSAAGPSPATDGELLFAYFGTHLAALDFNGEVVWLEEVDPSYLEEAYYGAGSSLVLTDTNVIVLRDRENDDPALVGWLAAYDKKTGERQWRRKWNNTCCSYTTPVLLKSTSRTEILVVQAGRIASFDVESGKRLWTRPQEANQPVASPVLVDDVVCSVTGAHGVKNATCWILSTNEEGDTAATRVWSTRKGVSSIASPVLYKGLLYTLTDKGLLYCYHPQTGANLWSTRLARGAYSASLVAGGDKIYAFSRWGPASVFAAAPQFKLLAENTLPQTGIVASPAIADGCLLVRTEEHLLCVEGAQVAEPAA